MRIVTITQSALCFFLFMGSMMTLVPCSPLEPKKTSDSCRNPTPLANYDKCHGRDITILGKKAYFFKDWCYTSRKFGAFARCSASTSILVDIESGRCVAVVARLRRPIIDPWVTKIPTFVNPFIRWPLHVNALILWLDERKKRYKTALDRATNKFVQFHPKCTRTAHCINLNFINPFNN